MAWPEHVRIQPGETRNPGGRPAGVSIVKAINRLMKEDWPTIEAAKDSNNTQERLAAAWIIRAMGDQKAMESLTNRTDSAVQQSVKVDVAQLSPEQVLESIALERERLELASDND
jgi:hypothetical protein